MFICCCTVLIFATNLLGFLFMLFLVKGKMCLCWCHRKDCTLLPPAVQRTTPQAFKKRSECCVPTKCSSAVFLCTVSSECLLSFSKVAFFHFCVLNITHLIRWHQWCIFPKNIFLVFWGHCSLQYEHHEHVCVTMYSVEDNIRYLIQFNILKYYLFNTRQWYK